MSPARSRIASWYAIANDYLHAFYRACGSTGYATPMVRREPLSMLKGNVLSLNQSSGVERLTVERGIIWLTSTPARGDIILKAGQSWELKQDWPFVIEALEDAELNLLVSQETEEVK